LQNLLNNRFLFHPTRVAGVNHVQEDVGRPDFFEGSRKRVNKLVGQLIDKPDGIGQQHSLSAGQIEATAGRVKGGEEFVFDQHLSAGQGVHQGRFSGVGIADEGDTWEGHPGALLTVEAARPFDLAQTAADRGNAFSNTPPIMLELRFSRTPGTHPAAESRQVRPLAGESRPQILELSQFDLELAGLALGALGKDVKNQLAAINDRLPV
jgi:hypothetical protein